MTRYYFARHGESTANVEGVAAGWSDVALTNQGRAQARAIGRDLEYADRQIDIIIASPLVRALDTAVIIADAIGYPKEYIKIVPELKEKSAGSLELGSLQTLYEKTEQEIVQLGGENAQMFQDRVEEALDVIRSMASEDDNVLIVAHAGIYKMAKVIVEGWTPATRMYDVDKPKNADLLEIFI